jgi:hypothetical protein
MQALCALILCPRKCTHSILSADVLEGEGPKGVTNFGFTWLQVQIGLRVLGLVSPAAFWAGLLPVFQDEVNCDGIFEIRTCLGGLSAGEEGEERDEEIQHFLFRRLSSFGLKFLNSLLGLAASVWTGYIYLLECLPTADPADPPLSLICNTHLSLKFLYTLGGSVNWVDNHLLNRPLICLPDPMTAKVIHEELLVPIIQVSCMSVGQGVQSNVGQKPTILISLDLQLLVISSFHPW